MPGTLKITVGQYSDKGRKQTNQDFHGVLVPHEPLLTSKGVAIALADGISSSEVGHVAAEAAVKSFLTDYYCTSETWSVRTSAQRVIAATNSWLHAQTRRGRDPYDSNKGYVCTLSTLVIKGTTAHIFHVGDARVYRLSGASLEQLTEDHRVTLSSTESYLGRALGADAQIEIDYSTLQIGTGDVFVLATDGVYEHVAARFVAHTIRDAADLDAAARAIVDEAFANGSADNLTVQIARIDEVPAGDAVDLVGAATELPPAPLLEARMLFDGYRVVRELHASHRSHLYLATDTADDTLVVLKVPSLDLRNDEAYLKRFMLEEWIARRIDSAHVLKPRVPARRRTHLYVVMEFVEGTTLTQWMRDNPKPDIETVRGIVEQIAKGLGAFHRMEMLHQDLRPDNVMIDKTGTVKIIDFGSTRVAGVVEAAAPASDDILGTAQYTAPEYFLGEGGSRRSDQFSLGVIAYQMLAGSLPYGSKIAQARTRSRLRKLRYRSALDDNRDIPLWVDGAIRRAVEIDPNKRYGEISEFVFDLRHPNARYREAASAPLLERNPLLFWQGLSALLAVVILALLARLYGAY
ncbi:MAG TPA: bifunctional protein-serine/threonine kinase/phosphatase [Pseudolabrys sp.]|nr:bifunctional protein-serine/threonine kinase/phosphatase [Pseudolabrys sp.]